MENPENIIGVINEAINKQAIFGASYSIFSPDKNIYAYQGFEGKDKYHLPLNPDSLYDLASVTKVIATTTRIMQLISENKLSLESTIGEFISDCASPDIKIKELLMHTSGFIPDFDNVHQMSSEELIQKVKAAKPQTRGKAIYSDLNFIYLGWIIEKLDHQSLQLSMKEHIFAPLGMRHTMYNPLVDLKSDCVPTEYQEDRGGIVQGQVHDFKAYLLNGMSGHAGLFSNLGDLTKFLRVLLQGGSYQGKIIFPANFYEYLKNKKYRQNDRALGWELWDQNKNMFWHSGFTGTSIAFDLDKKTGFICLTNRVYPTRDNKQWVTDRRIALTHFFGQKEMIDK